LKEKKLLTCLNMLPIAGRLAVTRRSLKPYIFLKVTIRMEEKTKPWWIFS